MTVNVDLFLQEIVAVCEKHGLLITERLSTGGFGLLNIKDNTYSKDTNKAEQTNKICLEIWKEVVTKKTKIILDK